MSDLELNLLHTLASNIPHRIYAKDTQGRFTFANDSVAKGMGVDKPSDLIGKTDFDFYDKNDAAQYFAEELAIMEDDAPMIGKLEHVYYNFSQEDKWLLTTKVPVKDNEGKVIGITGINYDITAQKQAEIELQIAMESVEKQNQKVIKNFKESLGLLTSIIEMQDGSKKNYTNMVVAASVEIAKALTLSNREIEQVRIAALLHNIGKLSLADKIRKVPFNKLSHHEKKLFKMHPIQGEAVLSGMTGLKTVAKLIRSHCEYLDGSGFPDKLVGKNIPIGSRIINVVSNFQKLESNLLVDSISTPEEAIDYIKHNSGKLYDARIVEIFSQYYDEHLQDYRSHISTLTLDKLLDNMVLGEDLIAANGLVMLTKDTVLTAEHLEQLRHYEIETSSQLIFQVLSESIDSLNKTHE